MCLILSMLGSNKNQSMHEIFTSISSMDRYKPYGGICMLYTGDFKQLGKTENYLIQKTKNTIFQNLF